MKLPKEMFIIAEHGEQIRIVAMEDYDELKKRVSDLTLTLQSSRGDVDALLQRLSVFERQTQLVSRYREALVDVANKYAHAEHANPLGILHEIRKIARAALAQVEGE